MNSDEFSGDLWLDRDQAPCVCVLELRFPREEIEYSKYVYIYIFLFCGLTFDYKPDICVSQCQTLGPTASAAQVDSEAADFEANLTSLQSHVQRVSHRGAARSEGIGGSFDQRTPATARGCTDGHMGILGMCTSRSSKEFGLVVSPLAGWTHPAF